MAFVTVNIPLQKSAMVFEDAPNLNYHDKTAYPAYLNPPSGEARKTLLKFGPVPEAYRYMGIDTAHISAYYYGNKSGNRTIIRPYITKSTWKDFDAGSINWNSTPAFSQWFAPGVGYTFPDATTGIRLSTPRSFYSDYDESLMAKRMASEVVFLFPYLTSASQSDSIILRNDSTEPIELVVQFNDGITVRSKITASDKTSGYVDPTVSNVFSWSFEENALTLHAIGPWDQQTATFYWRAAGESSWNSIPAGTVSQVTIPANTFPLGTVEWYVAGTDTQGTSSQTEVFTVSTTAALSDAMPVSPMDTLVNSDAPVTFAWSVSNANNPLQTGADLEYSTDGGSTWAQIGHADGNVRSLEVAAGVMPGGSIQWRVRSYNIDGVAGPWSTPASFYYIGAPAAPIVSATEVPFTTVTWTAAGQQAYEVIIDGVSSGIQFGTGKSYTVPEPLIDGGHSVQVRVQGIYGLWSAAGATNITVQNQPGDEISLNGTSDLDTVLNWSTEGSTLPFLIYRDEKRIGQTDGLSFRDRFVLGEHSYYVLVKLENGNYTRSNIYTGTMTADGVQISAAAGGDWIKLRLSENSASAQAFAYDRSSRMRHVTGAVYPVLELGQFQDLSGSYDVAFPDHAQAKAFEALFGQVVIVKSRGDNVLIGAMTKLNKTQGDFYISYSFTLQQIEWEDCVDDTYAGL